MNQSWLDQLTSSATSPELSAQTPAQTEAHTSEAASDVGQASEQATLPVNAVQFIERSDLAVVSFSGKDAGSFLQSQTCNDQAVVTAQSAQLNGYCSLKGRLLALATVAADSTGEVFYWLLAKDLVAPTVKRLSMFVLRSDVAIKVQDDWVVAGVAAQSDLLGASLEPWFGKLGAAELSSWSSDELSVIKARSGVGYSRSLLFGPLGVVKTSIQACVEAMPENAGDPLWSAQSSWTLGDIQAGVPSIVAKTQDAFVPQMVNLEQVGGLSFTKGCYPGQEIVARMQYLGKLKRTMVRFSGTTPAAAQPGEKLVAADDENAGEVVSSVATEGGMECLAVIKTAADISTFTFNGAALSPQDLPYT